MELDYGSSWVAFKKICSLMKSGWTKISYLKPVISGQNEPVLLIKNRQKSHF